MFVPKRSSIAIVFTLSVLVGQGCCLFKMTKAECTVLDPSFIKINECRVRPWKRDVSVFNYNATLFRTIYDARVQAIFQKRANGWLPFLTNHTVNCCEYFRKRNHPVTNLVYNYFKQYSNMNHSCPYKGEIILKGFYLKEELLKLPLPDGEYRLMLNWLANKIPVTLTGIYFEFRERF